MEDKKFSITINAPRSKVWDMLWASETYPQWTQPFCEGSFAEGDWQEGSKMLFLDPKRDGMISKVAKNIPNEFLSLEMIGEVKKGVEDYDSPGAKAVLGGYENYTLIEANGETTVTAIIGGAAMPKEIEAYLIAAWPKALEALKTISEK